MKPKHKRALFVLLGACSALAGVLLISSVFRDNLVFFFSPTDVLAGKAAQHTYVRVGGLVKEGSVVTDGMHLRFLLTDNQHDIAVDYEGVQPPMFREKQGMVADGSLQMQDDVYTLKATRLLTKHDEKYMPPEVVDALKKNGQWQHVPAAQDNAK